VYYIRVNKVKTKKLVIRKWFIFGLLCCHSLLIQS
jgi:hypothetical protein